MPQSYIYGTPYLTNATAASANGAAGAAGLVPLQGMWYQSRLCNKLI